MNGTLSIVATPIGNLGDITERALETLRTVDVILAEDTRNTGKLLMHFDIKTSMRSYHQHSSEKEINNILSLIADGQHLALVTDAGTPGISDPGNLLIHRICHSEQSEESQGNIDVDKSMRSFANTQDDKIKITPIPGAAAVTAALSISGFPTDKFLFLGFPPQKNKRNKYFEELAAYPFTVCFYESCHRIEKAITNMSEVLDPNRQVMICRELTKKFETVYRGTISEIQAMNISTKGEFVIVIEK